MKRLCGILVVCCLTVLLTATALADDTAYPVTGGNIYFDLDTGTITDCDNSVTSADIPMEINGVSVTSIGDDTFWDCRSLTSVIIPNSVTYIGDGAFSGCSSLTQMNVDAANQAYSSLAGVLFNKDQSVIVAFPGGRDSAYFIPDSVTSIESHAFYGCSSMTSVTIPNSVTEIKSYAFEGCSSLTSLTIPDSVTYSKRRLKLLDCEEYLV